MANRKKKVMEIPEQESPIRCEIVVGVRENSDVYFGSKGSMVDLIQIEGLLNYAEQEVKRQWEIRAYNQAMAAQQSSQVQEKA